MKFILMIIWIGIFSLPTYAQDYETRLKVSNDRWNIQEIQYEEEEWIPIDLHISYYTDLLCENTSYGSVDAMGKQLKYGTLAIPRELPLGTRFKIDGHDTIFTGTDRGSKKHIRFIDDKTMKIDLFIPRQNGENNSQYYNRVNDMGITKTKGYYKK